RFVTAKERAQRCGRPATSALALAVPPSESAATPHLSLSPFRHCQGASAAMRSASDIGPCTGRTPVRIGGNATLILFSISSPERSERSDAVGQRHRPLHWPYPSPNRRQRHTYPFLDFVTGKA